MKSTAKKPRRFRERVVRGGWTGPASASQPLVDDRLLTIQTAVLDVRFEPAERIARIDIQGGSVRYQLANGTAILAASGAHITWEEA